MSFWHVITGEYPPMLGGVGDYSAALASELATAGQEVHVWAPGQPVATPGVSVHAIAGFHRSGLHQLGQLLDAFPKPRTLLVQYAPNAFGCRGMNVPFCLWLRKRSRQGDDVRVLFHEVAYPFVWRPLRHNVLATVHRLMARILVRASRQVYSSSPIWLTQLRRYGHRPMAWLPIMASVEPHPKPERIAEFRARLSPGRTVGHFGTYGENVTRYLTPIAAKLLDAGLTLTLIGNGGERYRQELLAVNPQWTNHIIAFGRQSLVDLAAAIAACDVMVQPYSDGANARRTSLLATLMLGVATVSNRGHNTETIFDGCGPRIVETGQVADAVLELFRDETQRGRVAELGQAFYNRYFSPATRLRILLEGVKPDAISGNTR